MCKDAKKIPLVVNIAYGWVILPHLLMACFGISFVRSAAAFTPAATFPRQLMHTRRASAASALFLYNSFGDDKSNESESSANDLDDWRKFQQTLMANEEAEKTNGNENDLQSSISSSTVHQISNVNDIMPGSVLLATLPSKDELGYGLGRQYLQKSIIYIIDIDFEGGVTGLILNRGPMFELGLLSIEGKKLDKSSDGWIVNLGGDSFQFDEEMEEVDTSASSVSCLFFQNVDAVAENCREISTGVFYTNQATARGYAHEGKMQPGDFWLFYGHMHWSIEDFRQEIKENIWQAIDITRGGEAGDILQKLWAESSVDFGRTVWRVFCDVVDQPTRCEFGFDDKMLVEYCQASLPLSRHDSYDEEYTPRRQDGVYTVKVGDIIRASSSHSPFLLSDQEYHHSVILVIQEESRFSVGVILNLPTSKSIDLDAGGEHVGSINIKFGGPLECSGRSENDLLFLHKSKAMKDAALGEQLDVDSSSYNIWTCKKEEATDALARGLVATEDEIMGIDGLCVWPKDAFGGGGLRAELVQGNFERVPLSNYDKVWKILQQQRRLSSTSLEENLRTSHAAWEVAGAGKDITVKQMADKRRQLANEAHRQWILSYLLR